MGFFKDIFDYKSKKDAKFSFAKNNITYHPLIHSKNGEPRKKVVLITRIVLIFCFVYGIGTILYGLLRDKSLDYKVYTETTIENDLNNRNIEPVYTEEDLILQKKLHIIDSLKTIIKDSLDCNCPH